MDLSNARAWRSGYPTVPLEPDCFQGHRRPVAGPGCGKVGQSTTGKAGN